MSLVHWAVWAETAKRVTFPLGPHIPWLCAVQALTQGRLQPGSCNTHLSTCCVPGSLIQGSLRTRKMWWDEVIVLRELFAFSLGIRLVRISFLWSTAAFPCKWHWTVQGKVGFFCLCCCMPLRISLTLEVKLFTVAFVHGSVVLSTPDSHAALRGLGAVLFWKSQSKTIAIKWVCSGVSFVFHVRLVLVISSVEFLRRLVVGLNSGEEPSSRLPKSHVTPNPRLDTRLDLSLGLTQQLLSPCHSFTAFFSHIFGGQLLLPTGKLKGLSSSFPFSFSSLVVKSPACPSSTSLSSLLGAKNLGYFVFINTSIEKTYSFIFDSFFKSKIYWRVEFLNTISFRVWVIISSRNILLSPPSYKALEFRKDKSDEICMR